MTDTAKSTFVLESLVDFKSILFYYDLTVTELRPQLWQALQPLPDERDPLSVPKEPLTAGAVRAWGVRLQNEPVGLLVATIELWSESDRGLPGAEARRLALDVVSLAVREPFRRRGIATSLLNTASAWAQQQRMAVILTTMPLERPGTAAIERLTATKGGWEDRPGIILATMTSPSKVEPLLRRFQRIGQRYRIQMGYHIGAYPSELTPALKQRVEDASIPAWAQLTNPSEGVFGDAPLDRKYSRLLWRADKVIGWLVCHRPQPDLLRYTTGWVDKPWQRRGGFFVLLADVIKAAHFQTGPPSVVGGDGPHQIQQGTPIARGCFGFKVENYLIRELVEKHFRPCCTHYIETRIRSKRL